MVVEQHFVVWGSISNSLTSARDITPLQTLKPAADLLFSLSLFLSFPLFYFVRRLFSSLVSLAEF
jgi:hypothetical protein